MAVFENYERRIEGIEKVMSQYGIGSLDEARKICTETVRVHTIGA